MKKTKIEWCDATWNPVTGCLHGCPYCYARRIALRFSGGEGRAVSESGVLVELETPKRDDHRKILPYPYGFAPTFHRYKLGFPCRLGKPRVIFVCSMADLFGAWVPREWQREVFEACLATPRHKYIFLTKNERAYWDMALDGSGIMPSGSGFWYGHTATAQDDVERIAPFTPPAAYRYFLSVEPLHGPIDLSRFLRMPEWVIIGAETGNRAGKCAPKKEWVDGIADFCQKRDIPVFMKDSMLPVVGTDGMLRQFPPALERSGA